MKRIYIKTFEQFINEEGTAPDEAPKKKEEPKKEKPDYSKVEPTATKIMQALNKAGFEITQKDIVKWDGGDEDNDDGSLTVKIDNEDMFFFTEKGLLFYQMEAERVLLGKLNNTDEVVASIKDYFDIKSAEEKKKDEKKKKEEGGSTGDGGASDLTADLGDDSLGL